MLPGQRSIPARCSEPSAGAPRRPRRPRRLLRLAGSGAARDNAGMPNPISDPLVENVIVDDVASVVKLESTSEGVAFVTINRPAKRNAFDGLAIEGLTEAFETLQGAEG